MCQVHCTCLPSTYMILYMVRMGRGANSLASLSQLICLASSCAGRPTRRTFVLAHLPYPPMPTFQKNLQEVDIVKCEYSRASVFPAPVPKSLSVPFLRLTSNMNTTIAMFHNYYITPPHRHRYQWPLICDLCFLKWGNCLIVFFLTMTRGTQVSMMGK